MCRVFADYGLSVKATLVTVIALLLIVAGIISGLVTAPLSLIMLGGWGVFAFLTLPTRHLIFERYGRVRHLPVPDRRAARLIQLNRKPLFACAHLVGVQLKTRRTKTEFGTYTEQIEVPHYPRIAKPVPMPYGFRYTVDLPCRYGITATMAVKNQHLLDGYISELLRRTAPDATTLIEQITGSVVWVKVQLREEFANIVMPGEVE